MPCVLLTRSCTGTQSWIIDGCVVSAIRQVTEIFAQHLTRRLPNERSQTQLHVDLTPSLDQECLRNPCPVGSNHSGGTNFRPLMGYAPHCRHAEVYRRLTFCFWQLKEPRTTIVSKKDDDHDSISFGHESTGGVVNAHRNNCAARGSGVNQRGVRFLARRKHVQVFRRIACLRHGRTRSAKGSTKPSCFHPISWVPRRRPSIV